LINQSPKKSHHERKWLKNPQKNRNNIVERLMTKKEIAIAVKEV
jgi:hypothetical protein